MLKLPDAKTELILSSPKFTTAGGHARQTMLEANGKHLVKCTCIKMQGNYLPITAASLPNARK